MATRKDLGTENAYAYPDPIPGILRSAVIAGRPDHDPEYALGGRLHHPAGFVVVRFRGAGGLCVSLHPTDLSARVRVSYGPRDAQGDDPGDFALSDPIVHRSIMGEDPDDAREQIMRSFRRLRRDGVVDGGILGAVRAEAARVGLRFAAVDDRPGGGHVLYVAREDGWGMALTLPDQGPGGDPDEQIWSLRSEGRRGVCRWAGTVAGDLVSAAVDIVGTVRDEVGDGVD